MTQTDDLTPECRRHAERALGETVAKRVDGIAEIHRWLDENGHINAHRDSQSILYFLRGSKYNIDKAKNKMTR